MPRFKLPDLIVFAVAVTAIWLYRPVPLKSMLPAVSPAAFVVPEDNSLQLLTVLQTTISALASRLEVLEAKESPVPEASQAPAPNVTRRTLG